MLSQRKLLVLIILGWCILISLVLLASVHNTTKSIAQLEKKTANQTATRAYVSFTRQFDYLKALSRILESSENIPRVLSNNEWREQYFDHDFFMKNKLSGLILIHKNKVIINEKFNINEGYIDTLPLNSEKWIRKKLPLIIKKLVKKNKGGDFFVKIPGINSIYNITYLRFMSKSAIYGNNLVTVVLEREATPQILQRTSKIAQLPIFINTNKNIIRYFKNKPINKILIKKVGKKELEINKPIFDPNGEVIGAIKILMPRTMFQITEEQNTISLIIIITISIIGIIIMSLLIRWFFRKQESFTLSFERFFPKNLLQILHKKDILEIKLGDVEEKELSVLFLDIRQFTSISETLSPKENFIFINSFLKHLAPNIKKNNGFIDKYIGDAIMAIFTDEKNHTNDAVNAAFDLLNALKIANKNHSLNIQSEIKIGIGINSGKSMIGILGEEGRLNGTAIGDTINTASRIESLTKQYDTTILISQNSADRIRDNRNFTISKIDEIQLRGRQGSSGIYTVEKNIIH